MGYKRYGISRPIALGILFVNALAMGANVAEHSWWAISNLFFIIAAYLMYRRTP